MKNKLFNGMMCIILCVLLCCLATGCSNEEEINNVTTGKAETSANICGDLSDKTLHETTDEKAETGAAAETPTDTIKEGVTEDTPEDTIAPSTEPTKDTTAETTVEVTSNNQETAHTHKYNKTSVVSPSCSEKGYTVVYQCACGDGYNADYKDACGHNVIIDKAVASTCTNEGKTEGSHCYVCNTVIIAQKRLSAKGHSWSEWAVIKESGVGIKGEEKRICDTCKVSEVRSIAEIPLDEYEVFEGEIGVYYTDNVKYEYLKNHFDYSAYIQVYTLSKSSENEEYITNEFENYFGFKATAKVSVEMVGTYIVDGKVQTVYSYSVNDKTYPFVDHALYDVYHQICVDGVSHWVGFAIEGGNDDDWGELMSTPKVQALKEEMYKSFYEKTGCSAEYINSHKDDFCMGWICQAGTMRTSDGKLIEVLYIYCREK